MNHLFYFFKFGIILLLANELLIYLKNKYPNEYNNYIISLSYNFIFIYSKIQLITMKVSKGFQKYIDSLKKKYPILPRLFISVGETTEYVEFIKDGEIFLKTTIDNFNKINTSIYNFDFILLTRIDEGNIKNKSIYYSLPDDKDISVPDLKSNLNLIMVEIMIQDSSILVHFKNDVYNYLIDGNIFDCSFLIYFLKTHYKDEYKKLNMEYLCERNIKMKIIDGNVNKYEIEMFNKIKINQNDFIVIKSQEEEEKELFVMNKGFFLPTDLMEVLNDKISGSFEFNKMDIQTNSLAQESEPKIRKDSETEYECL